MQKQKHIQIQKKEEEKSLSANADVADVFSYWQSVFSKPKHTLTKEREKVLKARLKKYSVEDIMRAIDGCKKSPHHRGINKTGTVYDELTLICRSDTDLERFIGYNEQEFINGNGKQNSYISERAERAVTKHNIIETVRARVAEQDRTVSGQDAPDRT